jgi:hypothetical protein
MFALAARKSVLMSAGRGMAICLITVLLALLFVAPSLAQFDATNTAPGEELTATAFPTNVEPTVLPTGTPVPTSTEVSGSTGEDGAAPPDGASDESGQGGEPVDEPVVDDDVIEAGTGIVGIIEDFLNRKTDKTVGFAAIVAFFVGLAKIFGFTYNEETGKGIHSKTLSLVASAILWLLLVSADYLGYRAAYERYVVEFADLTPHILGFIGTLVGARFFHEFAAKRDIAVVGAKTPPPDAVGQGGFVMLTTTDSVGMPTTQQVRFSGGLITETPNGLSITGSSMPPNVTLRPDEDDWHPPGQSDVGLPAAG